MIEIAERRLILRTLAELLNGVQCEYGINDCSMFPAQWVADITDKELNLPYYDTPESGKKIIDASGGLVNVWSNILEPAGFQQCHNTPVFGDVGVIKTRAFDDVGVIFCDLGLALWRTPDGTTFISPRAKTILKVWTV